MFTLVPLAEQDQYLAWTKRAGLLKIATSRSDTVGGIESAAKRWRKLELEVRS